VIRRWRAGLLLVFALFAACFCGCRYRPKDTTIFKIQGKKEYDHARLLQPESAEFRPAIKLRFMDTNTFSTTGTLSPGNYILNVRASDGFNFNQHIVLKRDEWYYKVPEFHPNVTGEQQLGPKVSGKLYFIEGTMPQQVFVVFIAGDIIIRRVPVNNGQFSAEAPSKGHFRVEVHAPGQKVRSWAAENLDISHDINLGLITIR
jgi:hypothetical protein